MELFLTRYRQKEAGSTVVSRIPQKDRKRNPFGEIPVCAGETAGNHHILKKPGILGCAGSFRDREKGIALRVAEGDIGAFIRMLGGEEIEILRGNVDGTLLLTVSAIFLVAIFLAVLLSSLTGRRLLNPFQEITAQMKPINEGKLTENTEKRWLLL